MCMHIFIHFIGSQMARACLIMSSFFCTVLATVHASPLLFVSLSMIYATILIVRPKFNVFGIYPDTCRILLKHHIFDVYIAF